MASEAATSTVEVDFGGAPPSEPEDGATIGSGDKEADAFEEGDSVALLLDSESLATEITID